MINNKKEYYKNSNKNKKYYYNQRWDHKVLKNLVKVQ